MKIALIILALVLVNVYNCQDDDTTADDLEITDTTEPTTPIEATSTEQTTKEPTTTTTPIEATTTEQTTKEPTTTTTPIEATTTEQTTKEPTTNEPSTRITTVTTTGSTTPREQSTLTTTVTTTGSTTPRVQSTLTTTVTTTGRTTPRFNYCPELLPHCNCYASPVIVKCNNFTSFDQLDFKILNSINTSYLSTQTFELEIAPEIRLTLDNTLDLNGLGFEPNAKIVLRNIDGFDLLLSAFQDLRDDNNLFLYIYESNIRTVNAPCDWDSLPPDYNGPGLFAAFNYILFGGDNVFSSVCPLVFYRADIQFMEAYYMSPTNYLQFSPIADIPDEFDMYARVHSFKITFSPDFVVNNNMLNQHVFSNLSEFNLDNIRLAKIEDDAFRFTQQLTRIFLTLENVEEFIQSSENKWMAELNADVVVNYSNPISVEENKARSLIIQVNNRNSGQNYSYPDEDIVYFKHFPWDRMVFYRLLTDTDIECTDTMRFLLQNQPYYDPPSYLNTTSAYKCFLIESTTASSGITETISSSHSDLSSHQSSSSQASSTSLSSRVSTEQPNTSTKQADTVSLAAFLGVVIPLSVISVVATSLVGFFVYKLYFAAHKVNPAMEMT